MESLPFWRMYPCNQVVLQGQAFCLAQPGRAYAFYLPRGGKITIDLPEGTYRLDWWNPQNGPRGKFQHGRIVSGGRQQLTPPAPGDWAARLLRTPR